MVNYYFWDGKIEALHELNHLLSETYGHREMGVDYLEWKHLRNPLGKSIITFAKVGENLVGARAIQLCMNQGEIFYQPCDTVTHIGYRRKGLFSKLTNMALEQVDAKKPILNFPNPSSLPAYLKLGWRYHKKVMPKVFIGPRSLFLTATGKVSKEEAFERVLNNTFKESWREFCLWRFFRNPVGKYNYYLVDGGVVVVNKRRACFTIYFDPESCAKKRCQAPLLTYSYILDNKKKITDNIFLFMGKNGANFASKSEDNFSIVFKSSCREFSGLMDTF